MELPKGRYSVVEKGGRLIVIDNSTGMPAVTNTPSPRPGRPAASPAPVRPAASQAPGLSRPGPSPMRPAASRISARPPVSPSPIVAGKGMLDSVCDFLVAIASKEFDGDGNAIVGWEWKSNNRTRRWDARLDLAQQRRFGRALLAMCLSPLPLLIVLLLDGSALFGGMLLSVPLFAWGYQSIARLQKETGGIS